MSMKSSNVKTVLHAALCLFNQLLCFESESKGLSSELQTAFKAIDTCLNKKNTFDAETLTALLLCECRILYQNLDMCVWVEDQFKLFFLETHQTLKAEAPEVTVSQAVDDVMSMLELEAKK